MKTMENYKEMYLTLFNAITDEIERLKEIQQKVEDMYINEDSCNSQWMQHISIHRREDIYVFRQSV